MRKLLIKGGMAVLESGVFARDILVEGDTIAKMGEHLEDADAEVVDARGLPPNTTAITV